MTDNKPVSVVSRRMIHANKVWKVFLDHVRDDSGAEVHDYLVIAPPQPRSDLITGVAILPEVNGRLGLLRSFRYAVDSFVWEVPRGFLDPGEEPLQAARRELQEETGLVCSEHGLAGLGFIMPEPSTIAGKAALFTARNCRTSPAPSAEPEVGLGKLTFFTIREAWSMLDRGEIVEACTLSLIYRYVTRYTDELDGLAVYRRSAAREVSE